MKGFGTNWHEVFQIQEPLKRALTSCVKIEWNFNYSEGGLPL
jgi:hypothetical protein